jgi:hypothetical protein
LECVDDLGNASRFYLFRQTGQGYHLGQFGLKLAGEGFRPGKNFLATGSFNGQSRKPAGLPAAPVP